MTAFTARLTTAQLVLVVLALLTLVGVAGTTVQHFSGSASASSHVLAGGKCRTCM